MKKTRFTVDFSDVEKRGHIIVDVGTNFIAFMRSERIPMIICEIHSNRVYDYYVTYNKDLMEKIELYGMRNFYFVIPSDEYPMLFLRFPSLRLYAQ